MTPGGANGERADSGPQLMEQDTLLDLITSEGQPVHVQVSGKIDKGFFMAEDDWTCYRRNYFQLTCYYQLTPMVSPASLRVARKSGVSEQVYGLAMSISATVDGKDGRHIELVQHTPKRDKGPQAKPDRVNMAPKVPGYIDGRLGGGAMSSFDQGAYGHSSSQPPTEHTYERIQFKCATANNGRRRAAQQYYHLVVELMADLGPEKPAADRWVKIAHRISQPVVVRGRSPGHYQLERRHSNASTGGANGQNGPPPMPDQSSGYQRGAGNQMATQHQQHPTTSMMSSGGLRDNLESRMHQYQREYQRLPIVVPMEPIMPAEEIKVIEEHDGYLYYPSTLYEGTTLPNLPNTLPTVRSQTDHDDRTQHGSPYQLPNPGLFIKQEHQEQRPGSLSGFSLPSLTQGQYLSGVMMPGRFQGVNSSKDYFPRAFPNQELQTM
jgi:meiosis-specific transcription factor NDT80